MKKKIKKRKIELQAYIDYINDHIVFNYNNDNSFLPTDTRIYFEEDAKKLKSRLSELNSL